MTRHNDTRGTRYSLFQAVILNACGVVLAALTTGPAAAQDTASQEAAVERYFDGEELEELVGPIALYPDDLIAIILPASTYPLDIVQAARFLEDYERDNGLEPDPEWDDSIVALLNYPEVLNRMNEDLDWTWDLGEAFLNQQVDTFAAVQRYRERARDAGNLASNERQTVSEDEGVIKIVPAEPEVIYVPYYEPRRVVVYRHEPVYYYPRPYPVYYYPYPAGYSFHAGFFWGVTSAFSIGWHNRYLHVHSHVHLGHPYYHRRHLYYDPFYVRRSVNINFVHVDRSGYRWRPNYRRVAVTRYSGGAHRAERERYSTRSFEGRSRGGPARADARGGLGRDTRGATSRGFSRAPDARADSPRIGARSGTSRERGAAQNGNQRGQSSASSTRQRLSAQPADRSRNGAVSRSPQRSRDDANAGGSRSRIGGTPPSTAPSARTAPSTRAAPSARGDTARTAPGARQPQVGSASRSTSRSADSPSIGRTPSIRTSPPSVQRNASPRTRSAPSVRSPSAAPSGRGSMSRAPASRATSPAPSSRATRPAPSSRAPAPSSRATTRAPSSARSTRAPSGGRASSGRSSSRLAAPRTRGSQR